MNKPFQRKGAESNSQVGRNFEQLIQDYFEEKEIFLQKDFSIYIGTKARKPKKFDLGSDKEKIIVECKSHTWTESGNTPSAKITTWNQAMYFFILAPDEFKKYFFVLKDTRSTTGETLGEYYVRLHSHLIPTDVEIWEFDQILKIANKLTN